MEYIRKGLLFHYCEVFWERENVEFFFCKGSGTIVKFKILRTQRVHSLSDCAKAIIHPLIFRSNDTPRIKFKILLSFAGDRWSSFQ